jgi:hypothetical protein
MNSKHLQFDEKPIIDYKTTLLQSNGKLIINFALMQTTYANRIRGNSLQCIAGSMDLVFYKSQTKLETCVCCGSVDNCVDIYIDDSVAYICNYCVEKATTKPTPTVCNNLWAVLENNSNRINKITEKTVKYFSYHKIITGYNFKSKNILKNTKSYHDCCICGIQTIYKKRADNIYYKMDNILSCEDCVIKISVAEEQGKRDLIELFWTIRAIDVIDDVLYEITETTRALFAQ